MLKLVLALFAGAAAGFFLPGGFMSKPKSYIFTTAILCLLFFMGVNLGRDPEFLPKLSSFGLISIFMSITVVVFSILAVMLLMKIFGGKEQ